jgi:hypothetical protein
MLRSWREEACRQASRQLGLLTCDTKNSEYIPRLICTHVIRSISQEKHTYTNMKKNRHLDTESSFLLDQLPSPLCMAGSHFNYCVAHGGGNAVNIQVAARAFLVQLLIYITHGGENVASIQVATRVLQLQLPSAHAGGGRRCQHPEYYARPKWVTTRIPSRKKTPSAPTLC